MVGLVVEEVAERRRQPLRDGRRIGERSVAKQSAKALVAEVVDLGDDAFVLGRPRGGKPGEVLVQGRVE